MIEVKALFDDFISLIFPNVCYVCNGAMAKGEIYICTKCMYELPKMVDQQLQGNPLERRFYGKVPVKHVVSYLKFIKNGSVSELLYKLKYEGFSDIGEVMGKWFGRELKDMAFEKEYDLIVPVPLHESKIQKRGYNQSDFIAKGISEVIGIPYDGKILKRVLRNESQTNKGRMDRWKNVENIFQVTDSDKIYDKRILLIDDVLTTGSTLESCAQSLLADKCREVGIATLAAAQ